MRKRRQRGAAVIEFTLAGIGTIFLLICTFHISMAMWNYHTLAQAVHQTTRYMAVKGGDCVKPGYSCSASIGDIARQLEASAIGLPSDSLNMTLTTDSGAATACNPVAH